MKPLYLDHAATSWPKPPAVEAEMSRFLREVGANPGRSGHHLSVEAARIVYAARETVAELFGVSDPMRVVFGANLTEGLNLALHGLLRSGDHVVTSSLEHNSMMRPLRTLETNGVSVTTVPCSPRAELDPADLEAAIRPETRLIALVHASNVCGTLLPIREAARIARDHDLLLLVDTAQTAGAIPINMEGDGIDLMAFTGHKSLMGPMGTGGLIIGERVDLEELRPLKQGGTGSRSELEEQPLFLPDRYESGTPNAMGLAGLAAGARWVLEQGVETIRQKEEALTRQLLEGLEGIGAATVYGTGDASRQTATVSFTLEDWAVSDLGLLLDDEFGILCRVGLHCAPSAHHTIGTFPEGTVRLGPGPFIEPGQIDLVLSAIDALARRSR